MSLLDPVSNYCERLTPELLAEPLNAVSNAAFLIAAFMLYRLYKNHAVNDKPILVLINMIAVVGTGSTLFHTFANKLTLLADAIPIMLFVLIYLFYSLKRLCSFSTTKATSALALIIAAGFATSLVPTEFRFNGSVGYSPCLFALIYVACKSSHKLLYACSLILISSLTFRSIDLRICDQIPIGTHFMWHLLNGILLYLLVKTLINHSQVKNI